MVVVRLFAALRERAGTDSTEVTLQPGDTPRTVFERLFSDRPRPDWPGPLAYAVNEEYVAADAPLADGDELAFIPPLGGGAPDPRVALSAEPLQLQPLIDLVQAPSRGGTCTFTGTTRDTFEGRAVTHLEYEAYAPMALKMMAAICDDVEAKWPGVAVAMAHRVGRLAIGEIAVHVAAAGPHRDECFAACRYGIDTLKATVPIFKKEVYTDGSVWKDQGGG
jgi:molybdopterin synthase catalytic subunit/molybdopterin converting factor small subunit